VPAPLLIDCDPGHDDAIAILLALASPEVELLGVTTVAGNASLENTTANAIRVLELAGRGEVPVAAGCDRPLSRVPHVPSDIHGETGLDGPDLPPPRARPVETHAIDFLAQRLREASSPVTLVPVGPLTNVALFLIRYPGLANRLERIVLMGGAIGEGNITPSAEFNIWADPEAAQRVFTSGVEVTMIGLEVTHKALAMPAHVEELRGAGRVGRVVAELIDFFARSHTMPGSPIHDAAAVAHVVTPGLVEVADCHIEVECDSDLSRGRTSVDRWRNRERTPRAKVGVDVDGDRFARLMVDRIASLG
jgi:inosine-uridine nucleoside N-ribohydrolase